MILRIFVLLQYCLRAGWEAIKNYWNLDVANCQLLLNGGGLIFVIGNLN